MARLEDPHILKQYRSALANWAVTGYVDWKEIARNWVRQNLGAHEPRQIAKLMFEHVEAGGDIDQIAEQRPEWNDLPFHYDLRISVGSRQIYIEIILLDDDPEDPVIRVVNIHDA